MNDNVIRVVCIVGVTVSSVLQFMIQGPISSPAVREIIGILIVAINLIVVKLAHGVDPSTELPQRLQTFRRRVSSWGGDSSPMLSSHD